MFDDTHVYGKGYLYDELIIFYLNISKGTRGDGGNCLCEASDLIKCYIGQDTKCWNFFHCSNYMYMSIQFTWSYQWCMKTYMLIYMTHVP